MEITMSRVSLSLAVLIAIVCCADAMNYLAFPRMGRSVFQMKQHRINKRSLMDGESEIRTTRRANYPSNFFTPRKRALYSLPELPQPQEYFELDKKELPWNFIVPRKRGFPNGFFVPRKRGYLAFPRMGRSGAKPDGETGCCGLGLKDEFVVGQDGKEELRTLCAGGSECCEGLREIVDEKPDGVYYSMCIPDIPVSAHASAHSARVLSKLKNLLRK